VIRILGATVGRSLGSVVYAALADEVGQVSELATPEVSIGGELVLRFEGSPDPVVVTWAENAGWPDHFSLQARSDSAFTPGALRAWPASTLPPWSNHVGRPLIGVRVYAQNETPHVLELVFPGGSVLVGDGTERGFGDGDELIVRVGGDSGLLSGWQLLWASP